MARQNKFGNTSSSIALATRIAIEHNIKVLIISTSLNDKLIDSCFWQADKKNKIGIFGGNVDKGNIEQNGVQGLDRVIRSNKITPDIITNYTRVVLTNRLEVLPGMVGTGKEYDMIKDKYVQIITLADKYYDMVIVDLDRRIGKHSAEILQYSDIVVAMLPQRASEIEKVQELIKQGEILKEENTIMTIGRYMKNTKYNAKNITRTLLKKKEIVNIVPYNNLFFEASQEGKVIDLFINLMGVKEKDTNYEFINGITKLYNTINEKLEILKQYIR